MQTVRKMSRQTESPIDKAFRWQLLHFQFVLSFKKDVKFEVEVKLSTFVYLTYAIFM